MLSSLNIHQLFFALFFLIFIQYPKTLKATTLIPIAPPTLTDTCAFLDKKIITTDQVSISDMVIADIDRNGLNDIAISVFDADKIAWLKNNGRGNYTEEILDETIDGASCVAITDIEQDGDLDIYGGAYNSGEIQWWAQLQGGTFVKEAMFGTYPGVKDLAIADIVPLTNGACPSDEELIITSEEEGSPLLLLSLQCTTNRFNIFFNWHQGPSTITKVRATDMNNSERLDLVGIAPSEGRLFWWETTDRIRFPLERNFITSDFTGINDFAIEDFDNNGYQDIAAISATTGHIAIWLNSPTGEFSKILIEEAFLGAQSIAVKDIDGNGFVDIVVVSNVLEEVAIWLNTENLQFNKTVIATDFPGSKILVEDMDGDGDKDLIGASATTGDIYWWEYDCFVTQDCTTEDLILNESPIESATYAGHPLIQSAGTIEEGATVIFRAGESVTLNAGFHSQLGSNFNASIAICKATAATITLPKITDLRTSISNTTLNVYPNPATTKLTVNYTLEKDQTVQLYLMDILGRPVKNIQPKVPTLFGQNQEQVLVGDLQSGVYFVILQTNKEYISRKIIISSPLK